MSNVHYEVFAKRPGGVMNLEHTCAQESTAFSLADEMIASGEFVGVRVVRETLDAETGEFMSSVRLKHGDQEMGKARMKGPDIGPICRQPADLYAAPARAMLARVLESWLARTKVTPFELLHRLDLAQKLEANSGEVQHAIQKVAVPQSIARGGGVHKAVRELQGLADQTLARIRADREAGLFAAVTPETFARVCVELGTGEDAAYRLAGGVADHVAPAETWPAKVELYLDLADAAPGESDGRALAFKVLAQPLSEILASEAAMAALIGADLDLGERIAAWTRMLIGESAGVIGQVDPDAAALIPPLNEVAQRLAARLASPGLEDLRRGMAKRLLADLVSPRRLRPADPLAEVAMARALAVALSVADPQVLPTEEVHEALMERSRMLVGPEFIEAFRATEPTAMREVLGLIGLMESLVGGVNRTQAVRWIEATLTSPRFDSELVAGPESPSARLATLARIHRRLSCARDHAGGIGPLLERITTMGDRLEAERNLVRQVSCASAPISHRLSALLRMASGETATPGGAAGRAKAEAKRLLAEPDVAADLARDPAGLKQLQGLMKAL